MARPEYDRFRNALESLVEKTVDALERGRDEVLKEARVGKVKLLDIYQLRRERGRLYQRLGEEVYGLIRKGALEVPSLSRTIAKIAALDEKIQAKEGEIDRLRDEEGADLDTDFDGPPRPSSKKKAKAKAKANGASKKKKKPKKNKDKNKKKKKRTLGHDEEEE